MQNNRVSIKRFKYCSSIVPQIYILKSFSKKKRAEIVQ